MIDAAGAIYVIGGDTDFTAYHDVWASTDGGARPDSVVGGISRGYYRGYSRGCYWALRGGIGLV